MDFPRKAGYLVKDQLFKFDRAEIAKGLMGTESVVKDFDVLEQARSGLFVGQVLFPVDQLLVLALF